MEHHVVDMVAMHYPMARQKVVLNIPITKRNNSTGWGRNNQVSALPDDGILKFC